MESRYRTASVGTVVATMAGAKRPDGPEFKAKLMVEKVTAKGGGGAMLGRHPSFDRPR
jgi:hypothetical protein